MEPKQRRENISIEYLTMFRSNKAEFLRRFITMNEARIHYFTPEAKEQSKQKIERGKSTPKKANTVSSGAGLSFLGCARDNFH